MKLSISEGINNQADFDGLKRQTQIFAKAAEQVINGGLTFADNLRLKTVGATFLAANTNTQIIHGLNFIPVGYIVIGKSASFDVYNGSADVFTKTFITLRAAGTGSATIMVF